MGWSDSESYYSFLLDSRSEKERERERDVGNTDANATLCFVDSRRLNRSKQGDVSHSLTNQRTNLQTGLCDFMSTLFRLW